MGLPRNVELLSVQRHDRHKNRRAMQIELILLSRVVSVVTLLRMTFVNHFVNLVQLLKSLIAVMKLLL